MVHEKTAESEIPTTLQTGNGVKSITSQHELAYALYLQRMRNDPHVTVKRSTLNRGPQPKQPVAKATPDDPTTKRFTQRKVQSKVNYAFHGSP